MPRENEKTLIEVLWDRHYVGCIGTYHENMAATYQRMLEDPQINQEVREKMWRAIRLHISVEAMSGYRGTKPFTARFSKER